MAPGMAPSPGAGPEILVEESDRYARVIFNRPHVRNAITSRMWADLPKIIRRLERRRHIHAIVLSGVGGRPSARGLILARASSIYRHEGGSRL